MRTPELKQLRELVMLAGMKEMAAINDVARASMALKSLETQIDEVSATPSDFAFPDYAQYAEKWLLWRQQERERLNVRKAALKSEQLVAVAALGRAMAEHEVAKKVMARAETGTKRLKAQRKNYVS